MESEDDYNVESNSDSIVPTSDNNQSNQSNKIILYHDDHLRRIMLNNQSKYNILLHLDYNSRKAVIKLSAESERIVDDFGRTFKIGSKTIEPDEEYQLNLEDDGIEIIPEDWESKYEKERVTLTFNRNEQGGIIRMYNGFPFNVKLFVKIGGIKRIIDLNSQSYRKYICGQNEVIFARRVLHNKDQGVFDLREGQIERSNDHFQPSQKKIITSGSETKPNMIGETSKFQRIFSLKNDSTSSYKSVLSGPELQAEGQMVNSSDETRTQTQDVANKESLTIESAPQNQNQIKDRILELLLLADCKGYHVNYILKDLKTDRILESRIG